VGVGLRAGSFAASGRCAAAACNTVTPMCWLRVSWEAVARPALLPPSPTMSCTASMSLDARDEKCGVLPAIRIVGGQMAHLEAMSERNAGPGLGTTLAASAV
jgi:hypothetical protein